MPLYTRGCVHPLEHASEEQFTLYPSSQQLLIAPQLGAPPQSMLVSSCVDNHSYCELVFAMAMPCPEESISQPLHGSYTPSVPILLCLLSFRVVCALEIPTVAEHSQLLIFCTLNSDVYLH